LTPFVASFRLAAALAGILAGVGLGTAFRPHHEVVQPSPEIPKPIPITVPRPETIPSYQVPAQPAPEPASVVQPITVREAMAFIQDHEGYSGAVYEDSTGNQTIGYGFNLDAPGALAMAADLGISLTNGRITKADGKRLFKAKTEEALDGCHRLFDDFDSRPRDVQLAIADMVYNLGVTGFRKCYATYRALKNEDYLAAAGRMRKTTWSRQVGDRAVKLADMIEAIAMK